MQELFGLRVIPDKGPMYCSVCSFYKPRILYLVQYRRPSSASRSGRKPFKSLESDPYRPPSTKGEGRPPKNLVTPYWVRVQYRHGHGHGLLVLPVKQSKRCSKARMGYASRKSGLASCMKLTLYRRRYKSESMRRRKRRRIVSFEPVRRNTRTSILKKSSGMRRIDCVAI